MKISNSFFRNGLIIMSAVSIFSMVALQIMTHNSSLNIDGLEVASLMNQVTAIPDVAFIKELLRVMIF